ncbi:SusC/RagA family TonB-linked outer membrane protein [Chitinophaga eiseniae]|uniref:TonB-dependent receptor n=1 Tax=Chitinophaga eiseniae TaxID=634771 RepID=A0A847STL0_9BACT|nr:TonB-dependent receptor [Chitinophaga eiseniae]NLR80869.1 TonB-dependent receptor [Chitinophaga eiseniae]
MKSKQLPRTWRRAQHTLCWITLQSFLCTALWANDKHSPPGMTPDIPAKRKTFSITERVVKGQITGEKGEPLAGVTVSEKGTSNTVTSDKDGRYTIKVKDANSIIVFYAIGYLAREVKTGTLSAIDVKLETLSKNLNDVVVVGYGTQKKKELTNAVVQVSGAEIKKSTATSMSNSLSGRLSGVFVNQRSAAPGFDDAEILVRGPKTYRNSSALIVIDGVANADPDGLNRLDPNDIESISVLKDASAAVYGAQAAGGVILVTTKRGKSGKPSFDFSTTQSYQSPTMKVRSANVYDYMNVLNDRRALEGTPPDFPDDLIAEFKNGTRRPEDWYKALVAPPAKQSRQSLTMRGGTDRVKYFLSLGTAAQGGILRGDDKTKLRQYNVRSNIDVSVTDDLEVGLDLAYREKNTQTPQGGSGQIAYFANTSPLQEAYIGGDYRYPGQGWSQLNPAARLLSPGYQRYKAGVTNGTIRFKYNIPFVKGLSLDGFASVVKTLNHDKVFNYTWFYYERGANPGEIVKRPSRSVEDIGLKENFGQQQSVTENIKLSYNTIIKDHKISAFIAYEQNKYDSAFFWTSRLGYASPLIDQISAGSTDRQNWNNDGGANESARRNYFGRVNYEYKGKYLLGFSARYDGSTIFPKEKRFGFFPQASAGWVLSQESFIPKNIFSNLKLRASWGQLGNDRVAPFQYLGSYGYAPGWVVNGADVQGIAPTRTPNPRITWEVTETSDIGLETGFLNNRLTFELDVYSSKTSHILGQRQASIPGYTGVVLPDENIGKMDSKGFDFQAGYRQNFGRLGFRANGNISYSRNKIIFFDETPQAQPYQKLEGNPLGSILVYKAIGIYRTDAELTKYPSYAGARTGGLIFADLNNDGKIDVNDKYRFDATPFPKMQFGLTIGFDYDNFDLTILLQGQTGAKWRLNNGFNSGAGGNGLEYVALNSYSLKNTNAVLPMIAPNGVAAEDADFYYHKATWARLKSAELGYTLPKNLLSKAKIAALRLYLSGDNIFMLFNNLKKYGAGDPEFVLGNGGGYPNMRTFSFGANLTF